MDSAMSEGANWSGLAALALLIAGFGLAFLFLAVLPKRRNAAGLRALAGRRGWQIDMGSGPVAKGQGSTWLVDVRPGDGSGWRCRVTRFVEGNRQIRTTEFSDPTLPAPAGMIVVGPGLAPGEAATAGQLLGQLSGPHGSLAMRAFLGDGLEGAERLRPAGQREGMTVFASADADAEAVLDRVAGPIGRFRTAFPAEKDFPILIWSGQGCRVRLRDEASEPARLEAFVDHALAVCAALRRARHE